MQVALTGGWRQEAGGWRQEAGGRRQEAGSRWQVAVTGGAGDREDREKVAEKTEKADTEVLGALHQAALLMPAWPVNHPPCLRAGPVAARRPAGRAGGTAARGRRPCWC